MTATKEKRVHVIAAFKMEDRLVWRFVAKGLDPFPLFRTPVHLAPVRCTAHT